MEAPIQLAEMTLLPALVNNRVGLNFPQSLQASLDGNFMVIGNYLNVTQSPEMGAVGIFKRATPPSLAYSQIQFFQASDRQQTAQFGTAIAVNSNAEYILTSAPHMNQGTFPSWITDTGVVYVYKKNSTTDFWRPIYSFRPPDTAAFDFFGTSMAMTWDAQYLTVSSPKKNVVTPSGTVTAAGHVYIYKKSPTTDFWEYLQQVTMINPVAQAQLGTKVELSYDATYIVAGTAGNTIDTRMTCVFKKDPTTDYWAEVTRFCAQSTIFGTGSEFTISSNADYILQNTSIAVSPYSTFMFKKNLDTDNWSLQQTIGASDRIYSTGISPDGSNFLMGLGSWNDIAVDAGIVYLYKKQTTTDNWIQTTSILPSRLQAGDNFGYESKFVADGSLALCSAPFASSITAPGRADAGIIWAFGFATSKIIPSTAQYVLSTPPLSGRINFTLPNASSTTNPMLYYKTTPAYSGQQTLQFITQGGNTIDGGVSVGSVGYRSSYQFLNDRVSKWYTLMSYGETS